MMIKHNYHKGSEVSASGEHVRIKCGDLIMDGKCDDDKTQLP
nr:MAG TPA: hypothetical protein [Caudoviricetes sp.]